MSSLYQNQIKRSAYASKQPDYQRNEGENAMKRGTGKTVAVSLLTALLVSACGGNADKGAGNPEPVNDKGAAEAKETSYPPAKLVIYSTSGWTEEVFNERFGNAIKAKFPQRNRSQTRKNKETARAV